ncbi:efflux RND transporter periplasmic adaptor subunit [Candidatus Igneacidithiobacillus taiwanensis]|uniref:efflux RND transporter periplasmic adaptor subunit n=1 Tax=Candidatus Igneacidithiobacillus taiwanensis TaxID=1945924 RepID=UPI0028A22F7F|nr:efflux RND transporter periplasmic adaptor subunit [Candidatus Igneacidithiobacillus taiwanensis]MCE5360036.1 efflux RND transporter periplasmic adaptor subunit [Acidithiobacillus sp.]
MKKAYAIVIIALVILFGGIFGFKAFVNHMIAKAIANSPKPVFSVNAARVREQLWHPELEAVASLAAVQGTEISPQIAGNVTAIHFHSGSYVQAGQLLVQIDNSNQLAQLQVDRANLHLAEVNLHRIETLIRDKAASQAQLDQARATYAVDQAAVQNDEATLRKLAITAPFSGYIGIRKVNVGQYVTPGTALADLQSWNPLYVNFTLPQADLPLLQLGTPIHFVSDATGTQVFQGKITALGSAINPQTRQVEVQATLDNPHNLLRPGMFGQVTVVRNEEQKVLTVPVSAITYNTYGNFVYVVENKTVDGKTSQVAVQRVVHTGEERDGQVAILRGLKAGELVVTAGQVKLTNDAQVSVAAH